MKCHSDGEVWSESLMRNVSHGTRVSHGIERSKPFQYYGVVNPITIGAFPVAFKWPNINQVMCSAYRQVLLHMLIRLVSVRRTQQLQLPAHS